MFIRQHTWQQICELISLVGNVLKLCISNLIPINYKLICAKIKTERLLAWEITNLKVYFKLQV
jgi:hypothetical protein